MKKVTVFVGTRPEAIKLAPVIIELRARPADFEVLVCASGQHREMLVQALDDFGIQVDVRLDVMTHDQGLAQLTARLFEALDPVLAEHAPDWVLVQGDTTTVLVAAMLAFYHGIAVGHVEAGLRTGDLRRPFPEEMNRRVAGVVSNRHFAPTAVARDNLLRENTPPAAILVTGNTVVDALLTMRERVRRQPPQLPQDVARALQRLERLVLITGHRRENFGSGFEQMCAAIAELAERRPDTAFVYPVHLNPNVLRPVNAILAGIDNVVLCAPVSYPQIVYLMDRAAAILTDSGGIQEEGISLGKQVLVMRELTERPEGMRSGLMRLVGVDRQTIVRGVGDALASPVRVAEDFVSPYGDGKAALRIVDDLAGYPNEGLAGV